MGILGEYAASHHGVLAAPNAGFISDRHLGAKAEALASGLCSTPSTNGRSG
jgi:hypothetical protein